MQAALEKIEAQQKQLPPVHVLPADERLQEALHNLAAALAAALPTATTTQDTNSNQTNETTTTTEQKVVSASWLLQLCATVLPWEASHHLAVAVLAASRLPDETAQQQAALFDALGESEAAMQVLMQVTPRLSEIRQQITESQLLSLAVSSTDNNYNTSTILVDVEEERRQFLRQQAMEAAQIAAIAQAQVQQDSSNNNNSRFGSATHTVSRQSDKQAWKQAQKAAKRAAQALNRAKQAGAILEDDDDDDLMMTASANTLGEGGLMHRSQQQVWEMQQSLAPEGTRQYYSDKSGLPPGAEHTHRDGMEKVIIPAARPADDFLQARLKINDIMDPTLARAFAGTSSLNPMQSTVFEAAFHRRDNLLVCAPTGAGKTNVAMLTVAAHFRDVGLIGGTSSTSMAGSLETGKKVVYIAPMKALAQEVVEKFSSKLGPLRLIVRELTGDMQLTRAQAESANVIVTTPEKWDVVTRKSGTDERSLGNQCGLLIIDEVHLLADERGAVIESVVSRLHRLVESRQRTVRIVALSATLPNYRDAAEFLQVPERGLFFFGPEHRPVPLQQQFIGVGTKRMNRFLREEKMNEVCFEVVLDSIQRDYQVMVFVHSRKGTGDTARALADIAATEGILERYFMTAGKEGRGGDAYKRYSARVKKSRNREVGLHFENGMGIHHAGMLRGDRKLTEQMFNDGAIKVLCTTATLAWGINLPAHTGTLYVWKRRKKRHVLTTFLFLDLCSRDKGDRRLQSRERRQY